MSKEIPLTKGRVAIVDDDDYPELSKHKWCVSHGYAVRFDGNKAMVLMHRLLANTPRGRHTDHINGNPLDNRRDNLRVCTAAENGWNRGRQKNNKSGFKGVVRVRRSKMYTARITVNKKVISLGYFHDAKRAAIAYDNASRAYHGPFAYVNFPKMEQA